MADKAVSELVAALSVTPTDLFVLEQNGTAKKLTGQILENWLLSFAEGHGGIQSSELLKTVGLVKTYRFTLTDQTYIDIDVVDGRGVEKMEPTATNGLEVTYTVTYNDGTTSAFTVTNGAKGDKGDTAYIWVKYASQEPTASSNSFGDVPDAWMGVYFGFSSTAPTDWQEYSWYKVKGEQGDTGEPATLVSAVVTYQVGDYGTIIPSGSWSESIPVVPQGKYLWIREVTQFNTGDPITKYSVSRMGIDGLGSVVSVAGVSPDGAGNVPLTAEDVGALPIGGGDMEGPINMNGQQITGLNAPVKDTDAANKQYVDQNAGDITIDMEGAGEGEANGINADTLGGQLPEYYATAQAVADITKYSTSETICGSFDGLAVYRKVFTYAGTLTISKDIVIASGIDIDPGKVLGISGVMWGASVGAIGINGSYGNIVLNKNGELTMQQTISSYMTQCRIVVEYMK